MGDAQKCTGHVSVEVPNLVPRLALIGRLPGRAKNAQLSISSALEICRTAGLSPSSLTVNWTYKFYNQQEDASILTLETGLQKDLLGRIPSLITVLGSHHSRLAGAFLLLTAGRKGRASRTKQSLVISPVGILRRL